MSFSIEPAKRRHALLLATSIVALSPAIAFAQTPGTLPPVEISPPTDQNRTRARPLDGDGRGATRPQRTARPSRGAGTGASDGASTGTGSGTGTGGRQFNGIVGASSSVITAEDIAHSPSNNLPDILARWTERDQLERKNARTAQSFCVPKADIAAQGYDLSLNRYKEVVHEQVAHRSPSKILADLATLEKEIQQGMKELEGMLR